jgi:hypothetical protein
VREKEQNVVLLHERFTTEPFGSFNHSPVQDVQLLEKYGLTDERLRPWEEKYFKSFDQDI